jgi:hypothetical protein
MLYARSVALSVSVAVAFNAYALEIRLTMDSAGLAENASYLYLSPRLRA